MAMNMFRLLDELKAHIDKRFDELILDLEKKSIKQDKKTVVKKDNK